MSDWIEDGEAGSSVRAKLNTLPRLLECDGEFAG